MNIFCYKNILAAECPIDSKYLNDPYAVNSTQVGCMSSPEDVKITQEAIEYIKKNNYRCQDSIAMLMLGGNHIGILGFHKVILTDKNGLVEITNDCELEALDKCTITNYIPEDFKKFVDNKQN